MFCSQYASLQKSFLIINNVSNNCAAVIFDEYNTASMNQIIIYF